MFEREVRWKAKPVRESVRFGNIGRREKRSLDIWTILSGQKTFCRKRWSEESHWHLDTVVIEKKKVARYGPFVFLWGFQKTERERGSKGNEKPRSSGGSQIGERGRA